LGWKPAEFWAATLTEFFLAIHGHNDAQGGDTDVAPPSDDEMAKLLARYPDKPRK